MGARTEVKAARMAALAAEAAALPPEVPLTLEQAAALLQLSPATLQRRRKLEPGFPQGYLVAGQQLRFDRCDIDAYLERCREGKGLPVVKAQASRAARGAP